MVFPSTEQISIRSVPQKKGGIKFAVDQLVNQNTIILNIGGIYAKKTNIIVAGKVGTVYENTISNNMYKYISNLMRKNFTKIDSFFVGNEAKLKLNQGWRLVTNEKLSKDFDLIL